MIFCKQCMSVFSPMMYERLFDNGPLSRECPNLHCCGEVIEVDDIMVPIVLLFEENGIDVHRGNGGSLDSEDSPHLILVDVIPFLEKLSYPEGWTCERTEERYINPEGSKHSTIRTSLVYKKNGTESLMFEPEAEPAMRKMQELFFAWQNLFSVLSVALRKEEETEEKD
jgi:hypothetical protein